MTEKSAIELVKSATRLLHKLHGLLDPVPRSRDLACALVTDVYALLQELSRRFAASNHGFRDGRVGRDGEDEREYEQPEGADQIEYVSLAELMAMAADDGEEMVADVLLMSVREVRRHHFRQFLDYHLTGSVELHDVERKLLKLAQVAEARPMEDEQVTRMAKDIIATARRVAPQTLEAFNWGRVPGQIDVARKMKPGGEKRATTCAREQRRVEEPLKKSGARGFKLLGGTKSIAHRDACRQAQQGNTNRADADKKKRNSN